MSVPSATKDPGLSDQVVLRFVVYGPASAGKTTTARALGQNLGQPVETPEEEEDGTTVFFDWMEFEGGNFGGSTVRTQLITVPGHDMARRVALLDVADVVIFVADTTEAGMDHTVELFVEMNDELARLGRDPAVVVQANKRDHPTALPTDVVRARLNIAPDDPFVETVATNGDGVRMAFVLGMRHGLERHAKSIGYSAADAELDPKLLLEQLRKVESSVKPATPKEEPEPAVADTAGADADAPAPVAQDVPPPPRPEDAMEQAGTGKMTKLRRFFAGS